MRRTGWLANTALVIAATALPLGLFEAGLRVAGAVPPSIYEPDSVLIYRLAANGEKRFVHRAVNGGGTVPVSINADGFRGPPLRPMGSARRLMVYGDSFIEGEFVHDDSSFVRVLEHHLAAHTPTEVVNAGVAGWGPDQEFLWMQRAVPVLKPSAVVLSLYADNDMGDVMRDHLFRLGPDSVLEAHQVTLHPNLQRLLVEARHPSGWRRLHLVRWIERKLGRSTNGLPGTRAPEAGAPKLSLTNYAPWALWNAEHQYADLLQHPDTVLDLLGDSYDADVALTPEVPSARYKVAVTDRLLGVIARDVAALGVPLVVLVIPSPIDVCEHYDVAFNPVTYPKYDRRRLSRTMDSLATRHGMRTIDLWEPFRARDACALYFRGGDVHWNTLGQAVAARVVADSLVAWGIAP